MRSMCVNSHFNLLSIIMSFRVVRDQFALKSVIYQCVVKTTQDFFMNILYNRRQKLIDGIMRAKNAAIYYRNCCFLLTIFSHDDVQPQGLVDYSKWSFRVWKQKQ